MQSIKVFDAAVIGAGLAGAFTASALARRGARVALIDQASHVASKGSGNLFGLLTPYISTKRSPLETLYSAGYSFTQRILTDYPSHVQSFHPCGALQLPTTQRLRLIAESQDPLFGAPGIKRLSAHEATILAGTEIQVPALHIADAGFLSPRSLVETALAEHRDTISLDLGSWCVQLLPESHAWTIGFKNGRTVRSTYVIVCSARETLGFSQYSWLPLEAIRGQTTCVAATTRSASLGCVVSYGGYTTPAVDGYHFVGARYSHNDDETAPRALDTETILGRTNLWLPRLGFNAAESKNSRVCFRASTIDRLPYIGQMPNFASFRHLVSQYRSGTNLAQKVQPEPVPGLFVNAGHGSRGLLSCPLGGEIIARLINQEPLHELKHAARVTDPTRVLWRLISATS